MTVLLDTRSLLWAAGDPSRLTPPFDRILIAQAQVENITLLTTDNKVARYPDPIQAG